MEYPEIDLEFVNEFQLHFKNRKITSFIEVLATFHNVNLI